MASCENCVKIQSCKKDRDICSDFSLFGSMPIRPKKSEVLCIGCTCNWYNENKETGCFLYKGARVKLRSYPNSVTHCPPWRLEWKLNCFQRQW